MHSGYENGGLGCNISSRATLFDVWTVTFMRHRAGLPHRSQFGLNFLVYPGNTGREGNPDNPSIGRGCIKLDEVANVEGAMFVRTEPLARIAAVVGRSETANSFSID